MDTCLLIEGRVKWALEKLFISSDYTKNYLTY
jgi:hypothetical protein